MKIAVVGSRDYCCLAEVREYVLSLPKGTIIISGGARGVDRAAELAAYEAGLEVHIIFAEWKTHGKQAGLLRNHDIVAKCDKLRAFWDGNSNGTVHVVGLAKKAGKLDKLITRRRNPHGRSDNPGVFQKLVRR